MEFIHKNLNNTLNVTLLFFSVLSCFSCQNLDHTRKISAEKKIVITQSYFDTQADMSYLKAEEAFYKGDNTVALTHFKTALLFAPNSLHLRQSIASIYEQEGLLAEAMSHYKKLSQQKKQNKIFYQKFADIYILNNLHEKAIEIQEKLLEKEPDNFILWFKHALLWAHQKNWTQALNAFTQAETKAGNIGETVQSVLSQAYMLVNLEDIPKSLKTMNKISHLPIYDATLVLKVSNFYKSLRQNLTAVSYLENFQKNYGTEKLTSQALLDHYMSQQRWDKVIQQIQKLKDLGQLENYHYFYMALFLIAQKNYDKALAFLKDLNTKNPKNGQYLYLLATVYEQKKDWVTALKTYEQVQLSSSHFLAAGLQSALLLRQLGMKKKSFYLLKKLSFPAKGNISPYALLMYAESLWNSDKKHKALASLNKGLKQQPFHTDLLFLRGVYLKKSGQDNLSLQDMNKILTKEENHEKALSFIANFYSEKKTDLNKAEKLARKALSLNPQSSYCLNTLGWILFQKGDLKPALHYLSQAFKNNKTDSRIAKRLGTVYLQLKDLKNSDYFLKEALRLKHSGKPVKHKDKTILSKQALAN